MTSRTSRLALGIAAAVLLITAGIVLHRGSTSAASDASDDTSVPAQQGSPTSSPLASPAPASTPTASASPLPSPPAPDDTPAAMAGSIAADPALVADVEAEIESALESVAVIEPTAVAAVTTPDEVGSAFRSEVEAERLEFAAEGWTREGRYTVSDVQLLSAEPSDAPTALLVSACVDSSSLTVRHADGEPLLASTVPPVTTYFALERGADAWVVAGRSYPNDPRCDP